MLKNAQFHFKIFGFTVSILSALTARDWNKDCHLTSMSLSAIF